MGTRMQDRCSFHGLWISGLDFSVIVIWIGHISYGSSVVNDPERNIGSKLHKGKEASVCDWFTGPARLLPPRRLLLLTETRSSGGFHHGWLLYSLASKNSPELVLDGLSIARCIDQVVDLVSLSSAMIGDMITGNGFSSLDRRLLESSIRLLQVSSYLLKGSKFSPRGDVDRGYAQ